MSFLKTEVQGVGMRMNAKIARRFGRLNIEKAKAAKKSQGAMSNLKKVSGLEPYVIDDIAKNTN